ncbi:MAG: sugar phosphate isomerase/epimerase [Clostridia bacterium]|nr:sugar phosphate isomerase/epimerase [Clostridia bacterium]
MLQIGIRLHDVNTHAPVQKQTLEERAAKAREEGFCCVHLAPQKVMKGITFDGPAFHEGLAHYFRNVFARNELDVAVLGCYMNLADPDVERLALFKERYFGSIRVAALAGMGMVGTETGAPNSEYKSDRNTHSEEALQTFIRNLADVVACAEHYGVNVAIEPVWKHIVFDAQRALRVIRSIASPNLRIIFDPVNLLCMDNIDRRDQVISETLDLLCDRIAAVHLKDYTIQKGELQYTAAGKGEMDFHPLIRNLVSQKPYIQATLENTCNENAVEARQFIEMLCITHS